VLYIETLIAAPLEDVWRLTRDPSQHVRWDVRFSTIERYGPDGQFRYATRVLPGLTVSGVGFTAGERHRPDGHVTSALRFACTHPLSLISSGAGYWRYIPTKDGIRFLTGYDYVSGWGRFGPVADRAFRPLFGWATAWSFDRLRLWLERGISPERSRNQALAEATARLAVAVVGIAAGYPIAALVLLLPPLPATPAARRCQRRFRAAPDAPVGSARS
jgi:hypothetical protein